jgi:hypothetical protein
MFLLEEDSSPHYEGYHINMNICETEVPMTILARTCGCKERSRKVTYSFIDAYHSLCLDKKDIILAEMEACTKLLKYAIEETDKKTIEREILELKTAIDLMP